jgi:hypothetical protein
LTDNVLTRDTRILFEGSETVACNLLLVEDDALSRRNLAIFFQQSEQNVYEADTGEIAVELIDRITLMLWSRIFAFRAGSVVLMSCATILGSFQKNGAFS